MNVELTNGTTLNLGSIKGDDGIGISKSEINADGEFVLTYTNGQSTNLGKVVGADGINGTNGADGKDGINGADGKDGTGIVNVTISAEGALSVELSNGTVLNLGNIKGADGIGISKSEINSNGELRLTYTSGETANLGVVVGAKGTDGVGIKTVTLSADGELSILMTDNTVCNLGNIKGEKGDKGDTGEKGDKGDKGDKGEDGRGISKMEIVNGELIVTYTDGTNDNLGTIGSGSSEDDDTILIFTLLDDDTYSVSAGNGAKKVDSIEIPSTYNGKAVTQIADKAFMELSNITAITIPDSIVNIGEYAFYGCSLLSDVNLPSSLQSIQKYAFTKCTSITEITIPSATTYIGEYAFYDCSLTSAAFEQENGWVTTYNNSKKRNGCILLFSYENYDFYGNYYTDYEWAYFSTPKNIAQLLSGDYSASYYVYQDLKYRTVSMYKYAWSRS